MELDPVTVQLVFGAFKLIEKGMNYLAIVNSEDYDPSKINLEELKSKLDGLADLPVDLPTDNPPNQPKLPSMEN